MPRLPSEDFEEVDFCLRRLINSLRNTLSEQLRGRADWSCLWRSLYLTSTDAKADGADPPRTAQVFDLWF